MPVAVFQSPPPDAPGWPVALTGYFSAGVLLHAMTLVAVATILVAGPFLAFGVLKLSLAGAAGLAAVFAQLDARSRFQEFKQIRDLLIRHGPDRRIFRSLAGSSCRRNAALAAARQTGYAADCRACYRAAGYRWYHLLPDQVYRTPEVLLTTAFWRTTFFVPCYRRRTRFR